MTFAMAETTTEVSMALLDNLPRWKRCHGYAAQLKTSFSSFGTKGSVNGRGLARGRLTKPHKICAGRVLLCPVSAKGRKPRQIQSLLHANLQIPWPSLSRPVKKTSHGRSDGSGTSLPD